MKQIDNNLPSGAPLAPKVSIIIVTYKSLHLIDRCISPLISRPDFEIIVWDNASNDGLVDHVSANYPSVKIINSDANLGFARANNGAFNHCSAENYLLLNPDAFLEDSSVVDELLSFLKNNPDVGMVGPQLINSDGSHQVGDAGWRISYLSVAAHALLLQRIFRWIPSIYLTNHALLRRRAIYVDWVCGACTMVRKRIVAEVGGMDEEIFMYGEDMEWGSRIRGAGWRVCYLPKLLVLHLQGATQKGEAGLFFSTKWLDDIAMRYAAIGGRLRYEALRVTLVIGYGTRAAIWHVASLFSANPSRKVKASSMWKYAVHAFRLPPYSKQRFL